MAGGNLTRKQAIKAKRLDRSGGVRAEVCRCRITACPLWHYRTGSEQKDACMDEDPQKETA